MTTEAKAMPAPDFFALVLFAGGGGSWHRGPDKEKVIDACRRRTKADWGKLLKKGAVVKMSVFDVTHHDRLSFSERGVFPDGSKDELLPIEVREVKL